MSINLNIYLHNSKSITCRFTVLLVVSTVFDPSFGFAVTGADVSNDNCSNSAAISSSLKGNSEHHITSDSDILHAISL